MLNNNKCSIANGPDGCLVMFCDDERYDKSVQEFIGSAIFPVHCLPLIAKRTGNAVKIYESKCEVCLAELDLDSDILRSSVSEALAQVWSVG